MREKLGELDYILTPSGMQLYIGTPHTYYTIYQNAYDADKPEIEPFLLGFEKLELPILNKNGDSAWPERFQWKNRFCPRPFRRKQISFADDAPAGKRSRLRPQSRSA